MGSECSAFLKDVPLTFIILERKKTTTIQLRAPSFEEVNPSDIEDPLSSSIVHPKSEENVAAANSSSSTNNYNYSTRIDENERRRRHHRRSKSTTPTFEEMKSHFIVEGSHTNDSSLSSFHHPHSMVVNSHWGTETHHKSISAAPTFEEYMMARGNP